jgi:hypothetical protein
MKNVIILSDKISKEVTLFTISAHYFDQMDYVVKNHIPANCDWCFADETKLSLLDKLFFEAWRGTKTKNDIDIQVDISKAKEIWLEHYRKARAPLLTALDVDFMRAVESSNTALQKEIASEKQALRDVTKTDLPNTLEEIKSTWPEILGKNPFIK